MSRWESLESRLTERIGLDPTTLSRRGVEAAIERRMRLCDIEDAQDYVNYVDRSPSEFDLLAAAVMVHETSFFRYPASFELLVREVRARHLAEKTSTFRIQCVGCSTGEEPASIVMALLDAGIDTRRVRVEASDISARALSYARAGRYRPQSARRVAPAIRFRYFRADGALLQLDPVVTEVIHFRRANVTDAAFCRDHHASYDALFCRNVLIYLVPEARQRLLARLMQMLRPGGLLFVGHAEVAAVRDLGFSLAPPPDAFACRHVSRPAPSPRPNPRAHMATAPLGAAKAPNEARRREAGRDEAPRDEAPGEEDVLARASALADQGELAEARALLQDALRGAGARADVYHLLAVVESARSDDAASEDALRKALYLDADHYPALAQLALLVEHRGDGAQAARLRTKAERVRAAWDRKASANARDGGRP